MARKFYVCFLFTCVTLLLNWVVWCIIWFDNADNDSATAVMWSTIYLGLGVPGAWKLWYFPIYQNLRNNSTASWVLFFLVFGIHVIFVCLMALGLPGMSGAGWFEFLKVVETGDAWVGLTTLSAAICWTILAIASCYLLKKAHLLWTGKGGEEALQKEASKAAVTVAIAGAAASNQAKF